MAEINWEEFKKQFQTLRDSISPGNAAAGDLSEATFDLPTLQKQISENATGLQTAQDSLKNFQANTYNKYYSDSGLSSLKDQIAAKDAEITAAKQTRDTSISKTRQNPYYSAANITGESSEIANAANADINNTIEERNSLAAQYNSGLDDISKKVAREAADKQQEVDDYKYNLGNLQQQVSNYQTIRSQELQKKSSDEQWAAEFGLKLQELETQASQKSGDTSTEWERFSSKVATGAEPDAALRATAQRLLDQGIDDPARTGYTGETAARIESELGWLKQQQPKDQQNQAKKETVSEGAFRMEVRNAWKENYSPDQLKQVYGGVQFTDSDKSPQQIIDDEWNIKTRGGVRGWLGRLFRAGV